MAYILQAIGDQGSNIQADIMKKIHTFTPEERKDQNNLLADAVHQVEVSRKLEEENNAAELRKQRKDTKKRRNDLISKFQLHEVDRNEVMVDAFIKWEDDPNSCSAEEEKLAKKFHQMDREMKLRIVYGDEVEAAAAYFNGGGGGGRMGDAPDNATFEEEQEFRGKKGTHYRRFRQLLPKR